MSEFKSRISYAAGDDSSSGSRSGSRSHDDPLRGNSRFEKFYNLLDAVIDQVDMPQGRNRALKHGIRAIGEFISEMPEPSHGRRTKAEHDVSHHAEDHSTGRRTKAKTKGSKSSVSRRG